MMDTVPPLLTVTNDVTWNRILSTWHTVLTEYRQVVPPTNRMPDVAWWYNEQAAVGFLAAAIWRAGGVALQECATEKREQTDRWAGRCDLYAVVDTQEYYLEAKQVWIDGGNGDVVGATQAALDDAVNAAGCNREARGNHYGVAIVSPRIRQDALATRETLLQAWFEGFQTIPSVAKAWHMPLDTRVAVRDGGWVYPGVALFLQACA